VKTKGTILIVDDHIDEKIGVFQEYLKIDGYNIKVAGNLEEADKDLATLIGNNTLDGIILDFSFPTSELDASATTRNKPNGIFLFEKYCFKIENQRVPVVINTTADKETKNKYLGNLGNLGMPIYNVNHEANPLAHSSPEMAKEILKLFNERTEQRRIASGIKPDSNLRTGKSVIRRPDGSLTYSRYDGD